MKKEHQYAIKIKWTGNRGTGTDTYTGYDRDYAISSEGKPTISASSDAAFRGDKSKYNPEDLLIASLSACHMLWYLHLCSEAGIRVVDYTDDAHGVMVESSMKGGHFTEVTLCPIVTITNAAMLEKAHELHKKANELCFIANSVNFPVRHQPVVNIKED